MKKKQPNTRHGRAAIYARYSSHNQREASIEQQVKACRELAVRLGLDVVETYEDKAISGKSDRRPSFQRLLRDAEKGYFDCVLAWKSNRMGRNERYRGIYIYDDVRVEGGVPRIVSDGLFYRVQEVLKVKKTPQSARHHTGAEDYLLTGKLFCGKCGRPMTGVSGTSRSGEMHYYYTCQKRRREHACDKKNVIREQIEKSVAQAIKQYMLTDEMIQHMADATMAYNARQEKDLHLQDLQGQLAAVKTSAANLLKAIEMGVITETTKARMVELEQEQGRLNAQIENARAELVPITRDNFVSLLHIYRDGDINDSKYLASLFETFLVRVDLYDDHFLIWFNPLGQKTPADIPITSIENGDVDEFFDECRSENVFDWGGKWSTINHQDEHTTFITMIGNVFVLFCPFPGLK